MPNTTLNTLPYPAGTEVAGTGDLAIKALAESIDAKLMNYKNVTNIALTASANYTSLAKLTRRGNVVEIFINVTATANTSSGANCFVIPAAHAPVATGTKYFWTMDAATGAAVPMFMVTGFIGHVGARTNAQQTYGVLTYLSDA